MTTCTFIGLEGKLCERPVANSIHGVRCRKHLGKLGFLPCACGERRFNASCKAQKCSKCAVREFNRAYRKAGREKVANARKHAEQNAVTDGIRPPILQRLITAPPEVPAA